MKQSWLRFLCILLLILLPVSAIFSAGFLLPAQYEKTFLGEFDDMVARLDGIDEPKIVIIGGSSVAFGVDAERLGEALGMPVVNFGLYATLGTKTMLDVSKAAIREGDIIVLAPELNAQTFSLYFNAEAMWQAVDGHFGLLTRLTLDDASAMLGGFWKFAASKVKYACGDAPDPAGIYNASSFDEYGFIRYNRTKDYNILQGGYDASMTLAFDTEIISADFIDYVNEYVSYAEKRGARVLLGFCPMNEDALDAETTMETLETYTAFLRENFHAELLGEPNDYLYRSGYFYDSNFHLNSAGATLHTKRLAEDLAAALSLSVKIEIETPAVPEIPAVTEPETYEYDPNEVYFSYKIEDGRAYITGVTALGKEQSVLTTPKAYDGKKVVTVCSDAFAGCGALQELYLTDNISQILDGAFRGADALAVIHIPSSDPDACIVNSMSGAAFDGVSSGCRVLVPTGALENYINNYFWGIYKPYLAEE